MTEDISSDFEGDTDVDVKAANDPTSGETISDPDPLTSAKEQNSPDVGSSSACAEGLHEEEVTADSCNATSSASQTGISPVIDCINNTT